uniref:Protein ripply3 n=1 Tax=Dromaius novaehollandiae TaxID=8790 RepID=A0A8C4JUU1_DRONO
MSKTPGFFCLQRKEKIDYNTQARLVAKDSHSFSFKTCFLIRLYLPRSKSQKFLSNIGEKVLASFPVQATIHFYNDDIDSEEDEEEINLHLTPERDLHYGMNTFIFLPSPTLREVSGTHSVSSMSLLNSGKFLTLQKCCLQEQDKNIRAF